MTGQGRKKIWAKEAFVRSHLSLFLSDLLSVHPNNDAAICTSRVPNQTTEDESTTTSQYTGSDRASRLQAR